VTAAAVDALFTDAGPPVVDPVAGTPSFPIASVDAAVTPRAPEVVAVPTASELRPEAGRLSFPHKVDRAVISEVAGLADPVSLVIF
jgi:hypothetical protein